jgi:hypothetical protein
MSEADENSTSREKAGSRLLRFIIALLLTLAALIPLAISISKEWESVRLTFMQIEWSEYLLAQAILLPIMFMLSIVPWVSLHSLRVTFSIGSASASYFVSQIAKYLPGGIWAIPGRMVIYELQGVQRASSVVSVLRETTAFYTGAAMVAFIGLLLGTPFSDEIRALLALGLLVSIMIILLTHTPWVWAFLDKLRVPQGSQWKSYRSLENEQLRLNWLPRALLVSIAFWALLGVPFQMLIEAVSGAPAAVSWFEAAAIFAAAWCAGFVVILVPAGFGVRESALTFMLAGTLPLSDAINIALLARVWWVIAEGFWVVLGLLWFMRKKDLLRRIIKSQ